ncbi:MAG TPA: DUF4296 domain-containing protein [Parabacteroides sp.]|nr:DUF4296 domain-containing protein [Parabacteroides sp.]
MNVNKIFISGFVCAMFCLHSCSPVPDGVLSQKEMKDVLTDMEIAEALINADDATYKDDAHKLALYEAVFKKHHITRAEYDSSVMWYAHNLDRYMQVYNMAAQDVEGRIAALGNVEKTFTSSSVQDSTDIWPRRPFLTLSSKMKPFNGMLFSVAPKEPFPSGSSFLLKMKVWGVMPSMKLKPELRICINQGDTVLTLDEEITRDGYHTITVQSVPAKRVMRVDGYIRMDNGSRDYYKIYVDSISLTRFNYRSLSVQSSENAK